MTEQEQDREEQDCPHPVRVTDIKVGEHDVKVWLACRLCDAKAAFEVRGEDVLWYVGDVVVSPVGLEGGC